MSRATQRMKRGGMPPLPGSEPAARFAINFATPVMTTDPAHLGICSSTYGRLPTLSSEQAAAERAIDA